MKCYFCGHDMVEVDKMSTLEEMEAETVVFYCPHCKTNAAYSKPKQDNEDYIN